MTSNEEKIGDNLVQFKPFNKNDSEPHQDQRFLNELKILTTTTGHDYQKSHQQIDKLWIASDSLTQYLMSINAMKPIGKKAWVSNKFTGKGELDVVSMVLRVATHGSLDLREKRRKLKNPSRPHVLLYFDISSSMTNSLVDMAGILLTMVLMRVLEDFAITFNMAFISDRGHVSDNIRNIKKDSLARLFYGINFYHSTNFKTPIMDMENKNFYGNPDPKYVFFITDGTPEASLMNQTQYDIETNEQIAWLVDYLNKRVRKLPNHQLFWIQMGYGGTVLNYLRGTCGYQPAWNEAKLHFTEIEYKNVYGSNAIPSNPLDWDKASANGSYRNNNTGFFDWGKQIWDMYNKGEIVFFNLEELQNLTALNRIMVFFRDTYEKLLRK